MKKKRKAWFIDEDIKLFREFAESNKKWAELARKLPGRTQHQIKNRFFSLLRKELLLSYEKLRDLTKKNRLVSVSKIVLESLLLKVKNSENLAKNQLENQDFEEIKENYSNFDLEFNVEDFINFEKNEMIFPDLPD